MPADNPAAHIGRRGVLMGLGASILGACSKASFLAANVPAAFGAYHRHAELAYGAGAQHALDMYVPTSPFAEPRPLVVFWHGGRWEFGDKADYRFVGAALAERGFVTAIPNYRHYPEVKLAGFMQDAAEAAGYAARRATSFGASADGVFLMGHSAGAHIAAMLALDPQYMGAVPSAPRIAGFIGMSGPYDFLPLLEDDVKDMFGPPDRFADSQPINFVSPAAPPALLIHGLGDETVWPKNSRNLATTLEAHGVPATLKLYPRLGHADTVAALSIPARRRAPTLEDVDAFVHAQLQRAARTPA